VIFCFGIHGFYESVVCSLTRSHPQKRENNRAENMLIHDAHQKAVGESAGDGGDVIPAAAIGGNVCDKWLSPMALLL
jgi:pantoate kinase